MKNRQRGSAEMIVLIILLVLIVGIAFWWVWYQNRESGEKAAAHFNVGVFAQSFTTIVADEQGYLEDENLTVNYPQVMGSEQQFESLRDGEYDLALTAPDNVMEYRLNSNNALGGTFDAQAIAATNHGSNLSLVVRPEIESYEGLRGKTLAVDSPNSGFAYVLYQMMRNNGLERGEDYQIVEAGGALDRVSALVAGDFDGTLLLAGEEFAAQAQGMNILEAAAESIPNYLGGVIAARESWVSDNRDAVERLLRAYQRANDWIFDPANREAMIQLIMEQIEVDREAAERTYDIQIDSVLGLIQNQRVTPGNIRPVLEMRQDWGGFNQQQDINYLASPESGLYHMSYLDAIR